MSADYTPATILCLPWKDWTVNSNRPTRPVDPLTADQKDQWRTKGGVMWGKFDYSSFHASLYEKLRSTIIS